MTKIYLWINGQELDISQIGFIPCITDDPQREIDEMARRVAWQAEQKQERICTITYDSLRQITDLEGFVTLFQDSLAFSDVGLTITTNKKEVL